MLIKTITFFKAHFNPFKKLTLSEAIARELDKELREKMACEHTIEVSSYCAFMAQAKIEAIQKWQRHKVKIVKEYHDHPSNR